MAAEPRSVSELSGARAALGLGEADTIRHRGARSQPFARRVLLRIMLLTGRGPLRPVWAVLHEAVIRGCAAVIRWRQPGAAVYVKGSFAFGEPLFGVSDVDMIVVVPGERARAGTRRLQVKQRWERLARAIPPLTDLFGCDFWVYEDDEFERAAGSTCFTYGLGEARAAGDSSRRAAYFGPNPILDRMLLHHPGLYGPGHEWRLISGRDRERPESLTAQHCRLAAWLELQLWWRLIFKACLDPDARHLPFLCVKLVADPTRILLWLTHRERVRTRKEALHRALQLVPAEEEAVRLALELHDELHRSPPAPLREVLPCFVRLSGRIAGRIAREVESAGTTAVELVGANESPSSWGSTAQALRALAGGGEPDLLPLVDWRALALPTPGEEAFALVPGEPDDPTRLAAAALAGSAGPYPALLSEPLLVLPAPTYERCDLRAVQCEVTDPVSFALAKGRRSAAFPNVDGWSARDAALRAVAECRAWLDTRPLRSVTTDCEGPTMAPAIATLSLLLSAGRAALFLESIEAGQPQLLLTLAAVAEKLVGPPGSGAIAREASSAWQEALHEGKPPQPSTLAAVTDLVCGLPAYSSVPRVTA